MNEIVEKILAKKKLDNYDKASLIFDVARNNNDLEAGKIAVTICEQGKAKWANHAILCKRNNKTKGEKYGVEMAKKYQALYRQCLLWLAPDDFDSFMLYIELERPPKERFYLPRRKVLKPIVEALQELADDELDELFLSMPPRTGKTTVVKMFCVWVMLKNTERSNLYSASAGTITNAFYKGIKELLEDSHTYLIKDVFPENCRIAATNAKETTIDLFRAKTYATLTCRAIDAQLNGGCDCDSLLIADDLCGGIEEAMNPERMNSLWNKVENDLLSRCKGHCKKLFIGTRWSINDPTGRRIRLLEEHKEFSNYRYKVINLPALDENDESNFDYLYGVGFDTKHYLRVRASFEAHNNMADFLTQFQGEPIERQGVLFDINDMKFYNGELPDGTPDRVFSYCDAAFGGGDFTSMPIAYQFGERIFIHDVVFNNGDKKITQPLVCNKIIKNQVKSADFEYNNGGEDYSARVNEQLMEKGYHCNITGHFANTHKRKEFRIFEKSPEIREFYFRDIHCRDKEYSLFMQQLLSFVVNGKNKHDDAPDSLAGLAEMAENSSMSNIIIMDRFI